MPNWCSNTFEIVGEKEQIQKFNQFLDDNNGKDWFDFFAPCPQELKDVGDVSFHEKPQEGLIEKYGYSDWYSYGLGEWGCKWNCDAQDWSVEEYDEEHDVIKFWFDSPWGPPEALYENIHNGKYGDWYAVFAEWHEEGMAFIGRFDDGFSENYEYSDLESLDDIPEELAENWNLREMLEEREEWDSEDEEDESEEENEQDMQQALDELKQEFDDLMKEEESNQKTTKKWPN